MRVILSTRARSDLRGIGKHIAQDDPVRAVTFVEELRDASRALAAFPSRYPPAPEFGEGIRKRSHRDYLILYRVEEQVTIVAIRHAARLPKSF